MRWIIGDLHGMLRPLEALVTQIPRIDPAATLYFAGDYVNRGPDSKGVVDLLLTLTNAKFIRGNHDDIFDQVLHGTSYADNATRGDRFLAFQWFLEHGLMDTLLSYGVTRDQVLATVQSRAREALAVVIEQVPMRHRQFFRTLPVYIDDPDLFVVHGKWPPREAKMPAELLNNLTPAHIRHDLLWGRFTDAELRERKAWPKPGFFGHTPVPTYEGFSEMFRPLIAAQMVLVDTAAALSPLGRLSAICAETSEVIQADPSGALVVPTQS